jgi:hypothetical protein
MISGSRIGWDEEAVVANLTYCLGYVQFEGSTDLTTKILYPRMRRRDL